MALSVDALTPELLGTAAVGAFIILSALGNYLRNRRDAPRSDAKDHFGYYAPSHDNWERAIFQLGRIADALTDKNTAGINERLADLADRIDRNHESSQNQHRQRRQNPPK